MIPSKTESETIETVVRSVALVIFGVTADLTRQLLNWPFRHRV